MEFGDAVRQKSLLRNLLSQIGGEHPNLGQLGGALFDMSKALIEGVGDTRNIDRLREDWSMQTRNGSDPNGAIDGEVQVFQTAINEIAKLREAHDSYIFYIPGGSGIVRVEITIGKDGKPKANLADYGGIKRVKKNFEKLF